MPSAVPIILPADALARRQAKQSALAKLAMSGQIDHHPLLPPPSLRPSSVKDEGYEHSPRDRAMTSHGPYPQYLSTASILPPAMRTAATHDLTDTPPNPRSVSSTAPSSPRM
ncbi:hypothetical protein ACRE_090260 [Hapsidospora chrysogenum ATCC 11550]|uniref:Uncharacterized protein n=1 Tax=Hapsidospora chrysogenum (strain ATCC 11550 / CBS 779.69 / DSM 880 / IAM 14645 / JCM 23072 / IMI 49137) TaxID=857340 RepID=A0A086ST83_HAPC1|nr:hypothetical protein ACRE_090260 [Hapsidospora chrysogenum ATCC 11550]